MPAAGAAQNPFTDEQEARLKVLLDEAVKGVVKDVVKEMKKEVRKDVNEAKQEVKDAAKDAAKKDVKKTEAEKDLRDFNRKMDKNRPELIRNEISLATLELKLARQIINDSVAGNPGDPMPSIHDVQAAKKAIYQARRSDLIKQDWIFSNVEPAVVNASAGILLGGAAFGAAGVGIGLGAAAWAAAGVGAVLFGGLFYLLSEDAEDVEEAAAEAA